MKQYFLKSYKLAMTSILLLLFSFNGFTQYKQFSLTDKGDTINAIDNKNQKQGKWIIKVAELRGEPGCEEEGEFKNDKKEGTWRKYSSKDDLLARENYRFGGQDGLQQYYDQFGGLLREENWRAYNPDAPYDTIPIYGTGSNEVLSYKIVKADQYSVKHGEWKYYESSTGKILKTETYDRGTLQKDPVAAATAVADDKDKKIPKPKEAIEFDKKNSGKKKKLRDGQTGY